MNFNNMYQINQNNPNKANNNTDNNTLTDDEVKQLSKKIKISYPNKNKDGYYEDKIDNFFKQSKFGQRWMKTEKDTFVTFTFQKDNKQIFFDVSTSDMLLDGVIICLLRYYWMYDVIKNCDFVFNEKTLSIDDLSKTIGSLGAKNNSDIKIIYDQNKVSKVGNEIQTKLKEILLSYKEKVMQQQNNKNNQFNNNFNRNINMQNQNNQFNNNFNQNVNMYQQNNKNNQFNNNFNRNINMQNQNNQFNNNFNQNVNMYQQNNKNNQANNNNLNFVNNNQIDNLQTKNEKNKNELKGKELTAEEWIEQASRSYRFSLSDNQKKTLKEHLEKKMANGEKNKKLLDREYYSIYRVFTMLLQGAGQITDINLKTALESMEESTLTVGKDAKEQGSKTTNINKNLNDEKAKNKTEKEKQKKEGKINQKKSMIGICEYQLAIEQEVNKQNQSEQNNDDNEFKQNDKNSNIQSGRIIANTKTVIKQILKQQNEIQSDKNDNFINSSQNEQNKLIDDNNNNSNCDGNGSKEQNNKNDDELNKNNTNNNDDNNNLFDENVHGDQDKKDNISDQNMKNSFNNSNNRDDNINTEQSNKSDDELNKNSNNQENYVLTDKNTQGDFYNNDNTKEQENYDNHVNSHFSLDENTRYEGKYKNMKNQNMQNEKSQEDTGKKNQINNDNQNNPDKEKVTVNFQTIYNDIKKSNYFCYNMCVFRAQEPETYEQVRKYFSIWDNIKVTLYLIFVFSLSFKEKEFANYDYNKNAKKEIPHESSNLNNKNPCIPLQEREDLSKGGENRQELNN